MLEFFDSLKQDLQDAPSEVKLAFNNILQYFDKKSINLEELSKKMDIKIKDKPFYTNEQIQFIAAFALVRFPYITEIEISKSKDYDFSNEKQAPKSWRPPVDGIEFKIKYSGRSQNNSNSLSAVLAVKSAIRFLEPDHLQGRDHMYVYHNAKSNLVNVHYEDRYEHEIQDPNKALERTYLDKDTAIKAIELSRNIKLIGA